MKPRTVGQPCSWHKPKDLPYNDWHAWAEKQHKAGRRQVRCPLCLHVFYPCEWGNPPRRKTK